MRPSPLPFALLAGFVLALAPPAPAAAQQDLPVFGTELRVVAVPIFVTGKDGKGVAGLTADDFEVEDQGKKVPVAAFLAVDAGSPTLPTEAGPVTGAAARRQFLFLFDLTFSTPAGVTRAREAALDFLRKGIGPNDLVAVATVRPQGPEVLVGFTTDVAQAAQAVATFGAVAGDRLRDPLGLALDLGIKLDDPTGAFGIAPQSAGRTGGEDFRDALMQLARADRNAYGQRVVSYVSSLAGLGQLLNSVQGRKQVILLSAGFDQSVLSGAQGSEQAEASRAVIEGRLWDVQSESHFGDAGARSEMESLARALASSDVVVHTVDVTGLKAGGDASELGPVRPGSGKDSLAQIAEGSGGRFISDTNNLTEALQEVLDASRYYYVLAFEPVASKKKPGELRKLKIKVTRDGLDVSHRNGYTLPDVKTAAAAPVRQLQAAEVIAKGLSGGSIGIEALPVPYRGSGDRISLPVVLQVDGASLLGKDAKGTLAIEIYGYALDEHGRILDALGLTPTLDLAQLGAAIRQKGVQVLTSFRVVPGPVDLRFLVRNPTSGRAGSLRVQLEVPAFQGPELVVSSPLVTDDPRARVVIPSASRANPQLEIPFRLGELPFTADAAPALRNGEVREVCLMAWSSAGAGDRKLSAELVGASGQPLALETDGPRLVKDADGFARYVADLKPKGVPKGDYRLRLSLADPSGGAATQSELAVRVE
jgi:VWFA-related protein